MRKGLIVFALILIAGIVLCIYESSWIMYNIQKKQINSLELIEFYTTKTFSNNVKVISVEFIPDGRFFDDEVLKAELLVPISEINQLFPDEVRDYDETHSIFEKGSKEIEFSCRTMSSVQKLFVTTQRTVHFTVMKSDGEYTKVFISIDRLGWK